LFRHRFSFIEARVRGRFDGAVAYSPLAGRAVVVQMFCDNLHQVLSA
jgi:hypothetical protein